MRRRSKTPAKAAYRPRCFFLLKGTLMSETTPTKAKFTLGRVLATPGALTALEESGQTPGNYSTVMLAAIGVSFAMRTAA